MTFYTTHGRLNASAPGSAWAGPRRSQGGQRRPAARGAQRSATAGQEAGRALSKARPRGPGALNSRGPDPKREAGASPQLATRPGADPEVTFSATNSTESSWQLPSRARPSEDPPAATRHPAGPRSPPASALRPPAPGSLAPVPRPCRAPTSPSAAEEAAHCPGPPAQPGLLPPQTAASSGAGLESSSRDSRRRRGVVRRHSVAWQSRTGRNAIGWCSG